METNYLDYAPKGVKFYYVYKALAHPEYEGYVTPFTLEERLMHVAEARRRLQSRVPWLCDTLSNDLRHAVGTAPNGEFLLDADGRVVVARLWSDPDQLRKDLEELVGPVDHPTREEDLEMERIPPPAPVATGVVPRVQIPARMRPLIIQPDLTRIDEIPFYAKLRAEAEAGVLETGSGKLYLGFHLDPLYAVHWNNEVAPVSFDIRTPEGVEVTPSAGKAPAVEARADSDPREFLVDVTAADRSHPLQLTVRYFACDNANTFCIPVTQSYAVSLQPDPDGGSAAGRRVQSADGMRKRRPETGPGGPGGGVSLADRMKRRDRDGDGRLSKEEAPPRLAARFDQMDSNQDGFLDMDELKAAAGRMRENMAPPGQGRPPGR